MHELSICQALLLQVARVAEAHQAVSVSRILVRNGPLSGVDGPLLQRAFSVARMGTVAEKAVLELEAEPLMVRCRMCGRENAATLHALLCQSCGDWHTEVISGEGLLLVSVVLTEDGEGA